MLGSNNTVFISSYSNFHQEPLIQCPDYLRANIDGAVWNQLYCISILWSSQRKYIHMGTVTFFLLHLPNSLWLYDKTEPDGQHQWWAGCIRSSKSITLIVLSSWRATNKTNLTELSPQSQGYGPTTQTLDSRVSLLWRFQWEITLKLADR